LWWLNPITCAKWKAPEFLLVSEWRGNDNRGPVKRFLLPLLLAATFLPPVFRGVGTPASFDLGEAHFRSGAALSGGAFYRAAFIADPSPTPSVHAATLAELPDGRVLAAWFGGTREGAGDVMIYGSFFDPRTQAWDEPRILTGPKTAQRELRRYVRKVGNPVLYSDAEGEVWLFFVTVSFGGWSVSHLSYTSSNDGGRTWGATRRLVTSPFMNISTLAKGNPIKWADGSVGLPVYHEFLGEFAELLRLGSDMKVVDKVRMTSGRHSMQPVVVPMDEEQAVALLRNSGHPSGAVLSQRTEDAGRSWSRVEPVSLPNPNAAIAALRVSDDLALLVYNHGESGRSNLSLAISRDAGVSWETVHAFEEGGGAGDTLEEYSYPWLSMASDGTIHLAYTWKRTHIKHATFNEPWIRSLLD